MAKIVLQDVNNTPNMYVGVNNNSDRIEAAFENTLSRDGTGPNHMNADLDMNGYNLLNVGNPVKVEGIEWKGAWASATDYEVGDIVTHSTGTYIAIVDHESGDFATDLVNNKWQLFVVPPDVSDSDYTYPSGVSQTVQERLEQYVSVKDFGAVGDGITDDTLSIQSAIDSITISGLIYFPAGTYKITSPIQLPEKFIKLQGCGQGSKIIGDVNLIEFPASSLQKNQDIDSLSFEQTGDAISVRVHQTWYAGQKLGFNITNCFFYNSKVGTTTAKCISLKGVTQGVIANNHFRALGSGGAPTTGVGGYGVFFELGTDMNTSIMNTIIHSNMFWTLGNPIWVSDRVLSAGGRCEGIRIVNNYLVAGNVGIRSSTSLALMITNNLITDYDIGIDLYGELGFVISNNTEVDGKSHGIRIRPTSDSFVLDGTITGNRINTRYSGNGITLSNDIAALRIRSITISGNDIGRTVVTTPTAKGIVFDGTYSMDGIVINNNSLHTLTDGVYHNGIVGASQSAIGNAFVNVTNPFTGIPTSFVSINSVSGTDGTIQINGNVYANSSNVIFDLGKPNTVNTPIIRFHSSANANQYDSQIFATGGTSTEGAGALSYVAATNAFHGLIRPEANRTRDIGVPSLQWRDVYCRGIVGTTTNDNAQAGSVGEVISAQVLEANRVALTNSTPLTIMQVTLTPGHWNLNGQGAMYCEAAGVQINRFGFSFSTTTNVLNLNNFWYNATMGTFTSGSAGTFLQASHVSTPIKISTTTTYYMVFIVGVTSGSVSAYGSMTATRVR